MPCTGSVWCSFNLTNQSHQTLNTFKIHFLYRILDFESCAPDSIVTYGRYLLCTQTVCFPLKPHPYTSSSSTHNLNTRVILKQMVLLGRKLNAKNGLNMLRFTDILHKCHIVRQTWLWLLRLCFFFSYMICMVKSHCYSHSPVTSDNTWQQPVSIHRTCAASDGSCWQYISGWIFPTAFNVACVHFTISTEDVHVFL